MMTMSKSVFILIPILLGVAFMTLLERKFLGFVGLRVGPAKVSYAGVLQPIADALKLANKQYNFLSNFSVVWYYFSALIMFFSSVSLWSGAFGSPSPYVLKMGLIILMLFLSLSSVNSVVLGWSTFSKLSLIGSLRTVSQLVSYESVLYLVLFFVVFFWSSYSIHSSYYEGECLVITLPFCFFVWIPSVLAELNRTPYDFSEGESELVSGFNTEFGSVSFTLIFLAEYASILFFCWITVMLFFSGQDYLIFLSFCFMVIWVRGVLPRYRFDKLMMMVWKFLLPLLTLYLLLFSAFLM